MEWIINIVYELQRKRFFLNIEYLKQASNKKSVIYIYVKLMIDVHITLYDIDMYNNNFTKAHDNMIYSKRNNADDMSLHMY